MSEGIAGFDFSEAVEYHVGKFPPTCLDYAKIIKSVGQASDALARYDTRLEGLRNKELLLAPLRNSEAVVSSRMEGTVATLDEILKIQADADDAGNENETWNSGYRTEAVEVYSYTRAMRHAQKLIIDGLPICSRVIREVHSRLLFFGRGADKTPGAFKSDQNYVVDKKNKKVLFVPISHKDLLSGIGRLEEYLNNDALDPLIQTAVAHVEFEALHPFKDGNGRLGRMLIPLNLWQRNKIHAPHFYISGALEGRREEYLDRLRAVSAEDGWTEWVQFFMEVIEEQSAFNIAITDKIAALYNETQEIFRTVLASQWSPQVLDYVFAKPVFWNSNFTSTAGIPSQTAHRLSKTLVDKGYLTIIEPSSGRRASLLSFQPLLEIVRA